MKANELSVKDLMVGDWVYLSSIMSDDKYAVQVLEIQDDCIKYYCGGKKMMVRFKYIEPIPLTPEILEKNGWVRTKYCYGRDCMEIHGADELPEGVDNALSMARWSIDKNYQYHFLDLYMWKGSVMQHNVHYVHQLQHAFGIFGIDKTIEL